MITKRTTISCRTTCYCNHWSTKCSIAPHRYIRKCLSDKISNSRDECATSDKKYLVDVFSRKFSRTQSLLYRFDRFVPKITLARSSFWKVFRCSFLELLSRHRFLEKHRGTRFLESTSRFDAFSFISYRTLNFFKYRVPYVQTLLIFRNETSTLRCVVEITKFNPKEKW